MDDIYLTSDEDYNSKPVKKIKKTQLKKKKCANKYKRKPKSKVVKNKNESKVPINAPIVMFNNKNSVNKFVSSGTPSIECISNLIYSKPPVVNVKNLILKPYSKVPILFKPTSKPESVKIKEEFKLPMETPLVVFEDKNGVNKIGTAEIPSVVNTNNFNIQQHSMTSFIVHQNKEPKVIAAEITESVVNTNNLNLKRDSQNTVLVKKYFKNSEGTKTSMYNNCIDHNYSVFKINTNNSCKNAILNCQKSLLPIQADTLSNQHSIVHLNKNQYGVQSQSNDQSVTMKLAPQDNLVPKMELNSQQFINTNEPVQLKQKDEVIESMYELIFRFYFTNLRDFITCGFSDAN